MADIVNTVYSHNRVRRKENKSYANPICNGDCGRNPFNQISGNVAILVARRLSGSSVGTTEPPSHANEYT